MIRLIKAPQRIKPAKFHLTRSAVKLYGLLLWMQTLIANMRIPIVKIMKMMNVVPVLVTGVIVSYPSVAKRSFKGSVSCNFPKKPSGIEIGGQVEPKILPGSIVAPSHKVSRRMFAPAGILTFMAGIKEII